MHQIDLETLKTGIIEMGQHLLTEQVLKETIPQDKATTLPLKALILTAWVKFGWTHPL